MDPGVRSSAIAQFRLQEVEQQPGLGRHEAAVRHEGEHLAVVGAMAVIRHAKPTNQAASPWLLGLLEPRPRKLAAVALANKRARVLWAMMANGTAYRRPPQAA